jgi:hypothetical protein
MFHDLLSMIHCYKRLSHQDAQYFHAMGIVMKTGKECFEFSNPHFGGMKEEIYIYIYIPLFFGHENGEIGFYLFISGLSQLVKGLENKITQV